MLCDKCKHINLIHSHRPSNQHLCLVQHYATFDRLIASADNGCELCRYYRPFVECSKSRRHRWTNQPDSDSSCSESIGRPPEDVFEAIPYGPTDNLVKGWATEDGGATPLQFKTGRGISYEYEYSDDKYGYAEDMGVWDARRVEDKTAEIAADDAAFEDDLARRLERSRLLSPLEGPASGPKNGDSALDNADRKYVEKLHADGARLGPEIQWLLTTKSQCDGPEQLWVVISHYSDWSDVLTSARDDFYTATLTAGSINEHWLDENVKICLNGIGGHTRYTLAALHPEIWSFNPDLLSLPGKTPERNIRPVLEFCQLRSDTFVTDPLVYSRVVVSDPAAPAVLELARSWLHTCMEDHDVCRLRSSNLIPSRLIDVGDGASEPVRLHIVTPQERILPYAILSHCWGPNTSTMTKLTEANCAEMEVQIDTLKLARNFIDALAITRGLGLRYIWIDALCIIQDSSSDWAAEAAKMGQYYRCSALTICAVSSPDCQHGILRPRPETETYPVVETPNGNLYLRPPLPDVVTVTDAIPLSELRKEILDQPWNDRAWTLQERLFSRRILYFTADQMIWHCRSRFFGEDGQHTWQSKPNNTKIIKKDVIDILDYRQRAIGKDKKTVAPPSIRSMKWYELVQKYTRRQMTFSKDKLPALSSLARDVHGITKVPYVAGLWFDKTSMITGLMWNPVRDRRKDGQPREDPRLADNGSPSWSWASLVAEVEHPLAETDADVVARPGLDPAYISADAIAATSDPFGAVEGAELTLACWIHQYSGVRTFKEMCKTAKIYDWADDDEDLANADPDSPAADPFAVFDIARPDDLWKAIGPAPSSQKKKGLVLYIAFIAYTNSFERGADANTEHAQQHFLLLEKEPKVQGVTRVYKRVGVAVTKSGTLLAVEADNGWKRKRITIV